VTRRRRLPAAGRGPGSTARHAATTPTAAAAPDLLAPAPEPVPGPLEGFEENRRVRPVAQRPEIRRPYERGSSAATPDSPRSGYLRAPNLPSLIRVLLGGARTGGRFRSVLDQPPGDQPMEGTGSPAVPCPAGAPRPGALQGAERRLYLLHVLPAEPALVGPSAAGLAGVGRPDALLRHGYCPSPWHQVWLGQKLHAAPLISGAPTMGPWLPRIGEGPQENKEQSVPRCGTPCSEDRPTSAPGP
jgi:hypothetical protein